MMGILNKLLQEVVEAGKITVFKNPLGRCIDTKRIEAKCKKKSLWQVGFMVSVDE